MDAALPAATVHRNKRNNFKRRTVIVPGPYHSAQVDLIDYPKYSDSNYKYKHILVMVMIFSGKAYTRALLTKNGPEVATALDSILGSMSAGERPRFIGSDQGREFLVGGRATEHYNRILKKYHIVAYPLFKPIKAPHAERFNRTLKERLERYMTEKNTKRWVNVLQRMTTNINHTVSRTTQMAPADIDERHRAHVRRHRYKKDNSQCELKVGDIVKAILDKDRLGVKGYEQKYVLPCLLSLFI